MRIRWGPIALVASLVANASLAVLLIVQVLDAAHLEADRASTFRAFSAERSELQAMRGRFCASDPHPNRADVLSWESATRPRNEAGEPFVKNGLLWLRSAAVKFDANDRLVGVCPYVTWQTLDKPDSAALDNAGDRCPLEPLC